MAKSNNSKRNRSKKDVDHKKQVKRTDANLDNNATIEDYDKRKKGLDSKNRDNNPNWYFLDAQVAEQVSQMSFQQLAGFNIDFNNISMPVPNIVVLYVNPSPGVQLPTYSWQQESAINLAAFRLFTKLSAFTGRTATYGPQDISTMLLAFGEIISCTEHIRRILGTAYQMNMRNRDYPENILKAMGVDPVDLSDNLANYRTRFNTIVTMINQLPIPANVAYFDKCASLYEKIYLDAPSVMAQTIVMVPATTWILDETSYSGGTKLQTYDWTFTAGGGAPSVVNLSFYLNQLKNMVDTLLNSSSLQTVYTDLINLATKLNVPFWHFDYISTDYIVVPEYNENFSLQFHNATIPGIPYILTDESQLGAGVTPYNDVYPDITNDRIMYNPVFRNLPNISGGIPCCNYDNIIDMLTDNPSVEDRIEATRFTVAAGRMVKVIGTNYGTSEFVLPDHYIVTEYLYQTNGVFDSLYTNIRQGNEVYQACNASQIQHSCRHYIINNAQTGLSGNDIGDLNYYTVIDGGYLRRLHDFVGLGLYDLR